MTNEFNRETGLNPQLVLSHQLAGFFVQSWERTICDGLNLEFQIMAMEWIKMRNNLWDDPRVAGMADRCNCGEATILGGLYWLWSCADVHTTDGVLVSMSLATIDRKSGVPGFGDALVAVGWLEITGDNLLIPRFEEHNGASAKRRCQDAQRKATQRDKSAQKKPSAKRPQNVPPKCGQNSDKSGQIAELEEEEEEETSNTNVLDEPPTPLQKLDGDVEQFDELVIESEFLAAWNTTEGVVMLRSSKLPHKLSKPFWDRVRGHPDWLSDAYKALQRFPLRFWESIQSKMTLEKFIESVETINAGNYDTAKSATAKSGAIDPGGGAEYVPGSIPLDEDGNPMPRKWGA